jgi:hypothetical protein
LVTAAIVLWNTVYLGRALDVIHRRGDVLPDELLARLAPLGWQHINLTGDYLWVPMPVPARMDSGRSGVSRPTYPPPGR